MWQDDNGPLSARDAIETGVILTQLVSKLEELGVINDTESTVLYTRIKKRTAGHLMAMIKEAANADG